MSHKKPEEHNYIFVALVTVKIGLLKCLCLCQFLFHLFHVCPPNTFFNFRFLKICIYTYMFVKPYFVPYNKTDCIVLVIKRQLFLIFFLYTI